MLPVRGIGQVLKGKFVPGCGNLIRVDYHGSKDVPTGTGHAILKAAGIKQSCGDFTDD
jgi:hypothetical protein